MILHDTSCRYRRLTICQSLRNGNGDGETDYVEQFGMTIGTEPLTNPMRLITPPTMRYGDNSKERTVVSSLLLVSSFAYLDPMSFRIFELDPARGTCKCPSLHVTWL